MAMDPKQSANPEAPRASHHGQGIRIFTYPKTIFAFPTMIAALICGIGMHLYGDRIDDPIKHPQARAASSSSSAPATTSKTDTGSKSATETRRSADARAASGQPMAKHERFMTTPNLLGILFLGVFGFNLLIMAIDFPRFTIVAILMLVLLITFLLLWIGAYFQIELLRPAQRLFGGIYAVANAGFYYMIASIMAVIFVVIYVTRWLDYWEIMPNEILHHHGPLSDLERYPTLNLKFDKEIPDVLEFLFLGAGRLVLHVTEERKAIVLDNVLFINSKEDGLKRLMSRLEVRVTTDQEVAEP